MADFFSSTTLFQVGYWDGYLLELYTSFQVVLIIFELLIWRLLWKRAPAIRGNQVARVSRFFVTLAGNKMYVIQVGISTDNCGAMRRNSGIEK